MNTWRQKPILMRSLIILLIIGVIFTFSGGAEAYARIPFIGNWYAVDADGSFMLLNIGGPPDGPFRITWVDDYMTFCGGEAGIIRGTGTLNELNITLLEADLVAECFTTGDSMAFHMTFRYHPITRTLSSQYENGRVIIWRRSGVAPSFPALNLRVHYGDNWVESFYEAEHTAWVIVTESDGWTVKATAEVVTAPRDEWGGESGFQTTAEDWLPEMPDIQPGDWVYGWVDNGASAQVQIGEISGRVSTSGDFITGTVSAPFFSELVVECFPWGASEPVDMKYDSVLPDGADTFTCSWAGEWDITPDVPVGAAYIGLDGAWVATTFYAPNPNIVASESGDWFWTSGFYAGMIDIAIYASEAEGAELLWSGQVEIFEDFITVVGRDTHGLDLVDGNYLVISDGLNSKEVILRQISVTIFDPDNEIMAGYAPAGSEVWAAAGPQEWQERLMAMADSETGWWWADYKTIGFDILEEYRGWSSAAIYDEDGDANEGSTPPPPLNPHFIIFPEWEWYDGLDWPDGATVTITVVGKEDPCTATQESWGYFFNGGFPEGCDVVTGDTVRMTDGTTIREHVVQNLAVTGWDVDADTVSGTADEGAQLYVWPHEHDDALQTPVAGPGGSWTADFSGVPFDLDYNQGGRAMIYGEMGNATAVDWHIYNPHFIIFPEWEWYDGSDWPDGATVTITVVGKEDPCTATQESWGYFFNGGFPEGCDVVTGDTVRMTDGTTIREHVVQNLAVTGWDVDADTVSGTADEGAQLYVWPHEHDDALQTPVAGPGGSWTADFSGVPFDLDYNQGGRALIYGEMDNATAVDWYIPEPPHMWIWIEWNSVDGHGWGLYEDVTLTINGSEHVLTQNTGYGTSLSFDVGAAGHDIVPGDLVQMTNGVVTKEMLVPPLTITDYDLGANTVSGTYDPALTFDVEVAGQPPLVVDFVDNTWTATFAELLPLQWGGPWQRDADNDEAAATIRTPAPEFYVLADENVIYAAEWTPGALLTVMVNDTQVASQVVPSNGTPYGPEVAFDLDDYGIDLQAGDTVVLSDGRSTKVLVVAVLAVTGYDPATQTISGVAAPGDLLILISGLEFWVTVGEDGSWSVSSTEIDPGEWGTAIMWDEDGDQTRDIFMIPFP